MFCHLLGPFFEPQKPHTELIPIAAELQTSAGYSDQDMIGFNDTAKFERLSYIKIVVFHRSDTGKLEKFVTKQAPHSRTVFLYLHDGHYFMIKKLNAFIGTPYACEFCYIGYTNRRDHWCFYFCRVFNDSEYHRNAVKKRQCDDCLRYCKSDYCYAMHKKTPVGLEYAQCDVTKHCSRCNKHYHISVPKPHKCPAERCIHCNETLHVDGAHQCFIQPITLETPSEKYIFYDFETRYQDGKHVQNFVCAITYSGE